MRESRVFGSGARAWEWQSGSQDDGYSRDTFYRFRDLYEPRGELAFQQAMLRKPLLKNRVDPAPESRRVALSPELVAYGQIVIAIELRKLDFSISPAGMQSI